MDDRIVLLRVRDLVRDDRVEEARMELGTLMESEQPAVGRIRAIVDGLGGHPSEEARREAVALIDRIVQETL